MTPWCMALHGGSGCALGDLCAKGLLYAYPAIPVAFEWHTLFIGKLFASWIVDYRITCALGEWMAVHFNGVSGFWLRQSCDMTISAVASLCFR